MSHHDWVRAAARVPSTVFAALDAQDDEALARVLGQWIAGYYLNRGKEPSFARASDVDMQLRSALRDADQPQSLARQFPLGAEAVTRALDADSGERCAEILIDSCLPRWFIGWRDVVRATDVRTVIV